MSTQLASPIHTACHSSLVLDRWMLGELGPPEALQLDSHVETCPRCKPVVEHLRAAREEVLPPLRALDAVGISSKGSEFPSAKPQELKLVIDEASRLRPPRADARLSRRGWARAAAVASGLLAAAVIFMSINRAPAERSKGSGEFALGMYVQHGSEVSRAGPGAQVQRGDAVRFSITARSSAYAAVLSLDPAGRASIYFPLAGRAASVPAGADVPLPLSTRLDETVGEEQLVGLLCTTPIDLDPVRASLERGALQVPKDCQLAQWSFVKH